MSIIAKGGRPMCAVGAPAADKNDLVTLIIQIIGPQRTRGRF